MRGAMAMFSDVECGYSDRAKYSASYRHLANHVGHVFSIRASFLSIRGSITLATWCVLDMRILNVVRARIPAHLDLRET